MDEATEAISIEQLTNSLTFIPENNKFYTLWNFLISMISLVQTIIYAIYAGWGFAAEIHNWQNILLASIEFIYLLNILIQFFIAYDE